MDASRLTRVPRRSIASDARQQITQLITDGVLKPNQRLPPERELIEALGVSRSTLREGISGLAAMGILETRQGAGTFVSDLDPARIAEPLVLIVSLNSDVLHELADVRRMLESGAIQLAAPRITDAELADLRRVMRSARAVQDDVDAFISHDVEFHRIIHRAAGNELLLALLNGVERLARGSRNVTSQGEATRRRAVRDHAAILKALEARDPAAARAAMLKHLDYMRKVLDRDAPKRGTVP